MVCIYSRVQTNKQSGGIKYNLPPGYDGNAFSNDMNVKYHEPNNELLYEETHDSTDNHRSKSKTINDEKAKPDIITTEDSTFTEKPEANIGIQAFDALFKRLHGKIGREELIIILVMLLIGSEGLCPEMLILALILTLD